GDHRHADHTPPVAVASRPASRAAGTGTTREAHDDGALRDEIARLSARVSVLEAATAGDTTVRGLEEVRREVAALQRTRPAEASGDRPTRADAERERRAQMRVIESTFWDEPVEYG